MGVTGPGGGLGYGGIGLGGGTTGPFLLAMQWFPWGEKLLGHAL